MWRKLLDVAAGFLIIIAGLLGLLIWEWSCETGAWAAEFTVCNFWTKGPHEYHSFPN